VEGWGGGIEFGKYGKKKGITYSNIRMEEKTVIQPHSELSCTLGKQWTIRQEQTRAKGIS